MVTDGEVHVYDVILPSTTHNESTGTSTADPTLHIPAWTMDASLPGDQNHRSTSKSEGAKYLGTLMSVEPTGRFLSVATDALNSQSLTGHTGKALLPYLASIAKCPGPKREMPSAQPSR